MSDEDHGIFEDDEGELTAVLVPRLAANVDQETVKEILTARQRPQANKVALEWHIGRFERRLLDLMPRRPARSFWA